VTYNMRLNSMIGFLAPYSQTTREYRKLQCYCYSTHMFTVANALGLSVFISRILAMDFSPSDCNFTSHMKSPFHGLIPFLPLFCNCQFRRLYSLLSTTLLYSSSKSKSESELLYDWRFTANQFA
jgi:hypothetical protein